MYTYRQVSMRFFRASSSCPAGWFEFGFDEVVLTADIDLLRQAFSGHIALARGDGSELRTTAYGRSEGSTD